MTVRSTGSSGGVILLVSPTHHRWEAFLTGSTSSMQRVLNKPGMDLSPLPQKTKEAQDPGNREGSVNLDGLGRRGGPQGKSVPLPGCARGGRRGQGRGQRRASGCDGDERCTTGTTYVRQQEELLTYYCTFDVGPPTDCASR